MRKGRKKVFCPVPLPPPYYGSNIAVKDLVSSPQLIQEFELNVLPISYNFDTEGVGRFKLKKIFLIFKFFFFILIKSFQKYDLVYYVPAVKGFAFIRDFFLLLPLKLSKKKIIIHLHGIGIKNKASKNVIYRMLYKFFFKNTNVICLSERLVYDIEDVFNGPVYIVHNGIKPETYLPHKNNIPVLLFLSNFIESKGIFVLLEAIHILKSQKFDFKLYLIGSPRGNIMDKINNIISEYDLESHILSIGPKYGEEKKKVFQDADIFVFPTYHEAWGLVNLEAMQAGLPVISTDEGAIPDIVEDGITGFISRKQDPVDLANKIAILLKDENLRSKMGNKGREKFLKNYTHDLVVEKIIDVFNKVID